MPGGHTVRSARLLSGLLCSGKLDIHVKSDITAATPQVSLSDQQVLLGFFYCKLLRMKLYIEKPKTVEATQFDGTEEMAIQIASKDEFEGMVDYHQKKFHALWIHAGDRELRVNTGDYIIRDWSGEYSLLSEKNFNRYYKELE